MLLCFINFHILGEFSLELIYSFLVITTLEKTNTSVFYLFGLFGFFLRAQLALAFQMWLLSSGEEELVALVCILGNRLSVCLLQEQNKTLSRYALQFKNPCQRKLNTLKKRGFIDMFWRAH